MKIVERFLAPYEVLSVIMIDMPFATIETGARRSHSLSATVEIWIWLKFHANNSTRTKLVAY